MMSVALLLLILSSPLDRVTPTGPRVAVVDELVLTPALERAKSRAAIDQAVTAAIDDRGWQAVVVPTDCHDLACTSAVAKAANTPYAVVLSGRFVPSETYAADVGVALWRDGAAVSSRGEADEEADAQREGGDLRKFLRCGPPSGACTAQLLTSKLQRYVGTLIEEEISAIRARQAASIAAATQPRAPAPPVLVPPPPQSTPAEGGGRNRVLGWSLTGLGAALGAGAIGLWAFNRTGLDCHDVAGDSSGCRRFRSTGTAAAVTGAAAVAAAGVGLAILFLDRGPAHVALSMGSSSLSLGGRF